MVAFFTVSLVALFSMMDGNTRRDLLKASSAAIIAIPIGNRFQNAGGGTSLSFEGGTVGSATPPDPWYLQNRPENKICNVSSERASDGSKSMHIGSHGDLREVQVAVDVNLSNVESVLYDGYLVESDPNWGDIKVNVGNETISGRLVNDDPPDGRWYTDIEGDTSGISGEQTLYFWVRGDPNEAYFDNFRFRGSNGDLLPVSDVVVGMSDTNGGANVQAEIRSLSPNGNSFAPGDTIEATVTVVNTGGSEHTFFVGYSATPVESDTFYDNNDSTGQQVTLSSGESRTVDVSVSIPDNAPTGDYTVIASIWEESDRNNLQTRLDSTEQTVVIGSSEASLCDSPPIGPYDIELSPISASETNAFFEMEVTAAGGSYEFVSPIQVTTNDSVRIRRVTPLTDQSVLEAVGGKIVVGVVGAANPTPIPITDIASIYTTFKEESRENELSNVNRVGLDLRSEADLEGVRFLVWIESSEAISDWSTPGQFSLSQSEDISSPVRVSYVAEKEPLPSETDFEGTRTTNVFCMDFPTDEY